MLRATLLKDLIESLCVFMNPLIDCGGTLYWVSSHLCFIYFVLISTLLMGLSEL